METFPLDYYELKLTVQRLFWMLNTCAMLEILQPGTVVHLSTLNA